MNKILLVLLTVLTTSFAYAQDVILKKDSSEIKAKVIEITDQQVKYKNFDFQDGPTRSLNISEVFMITYENGQKEVFNTISETKVPDPKPQSATNCAKEYAFGMDIGLGGFFLGYNGLRSDTFFATAFGVRVTHHFNPYFGVDILKINWITDIFTAGNAYTVRIQIMPGIRGNSPTFYKCMSAYAAFRLGYAMDIFEPHFLGLGIETELGLNFSRTIFAGFAYNYHGYFGNGYDGIVGHTLAFRIGFNLGK